MKKEMIFELYYVYEGIVKAMSPRIFSHREDAIVYAREFADSVVSMKHTLHDVSDGGEFGFFDFGPYTYIGHVLLEFLFDTTEGVCHGLVLLVPRMVD